MLVDADRSAGGVDPLAQLAGERGPHLRGDRREVDGQSEAGEQVEQADEPLVVPAGVVVADEDGDGRMRVVERVANGFEPRRHQG